MNLCRGKHHGAVANPAKKTVDVDPGRRMKRRQPTGQQMSLGKKHGGDLEAREKTSWRWFWKVGPRFAGCLADDAYVPI